MASETADVVIEVHEKPIHVEDPIVSSLESEIKEVIKDPKTAEDDHKSWSIPNVPAFIRCRCPRSYNPRIVSIGPYHAGKSILARMQNVKIQYLKNLIDRNTNSNSLENYVDIVKNHVDDARERYVDLKPYDNNDELLQMLERMYPEDAEKEFVMMLVRDGCFIIEFLAKFFLNKRQDPFVKTNLSLLWNDLLMVENQIPFSILESLLHKSQIEGITTATDGPPVSLVELALFCFSGNQTIGEVGAKMFNNDEKSFHHLLHLYHTLLNPQFSKRLRARLWLHNLLNLFLDSFGIRLLFSVFYFVFYLPFTLFECFTTLKQHDRSPASTDVDQGLMTRDGDSINQVAPMPSGRRPWKQLATFKGWNPIQRFRDSLKMAFSHPRPWMSGIPNACYLRDTGFSFKVKYAPSFLEVSYQRRTIMVPELTIEDGTLAHFQNLIAFEQTSPKYGNHVTAFARLMDDLIDSSDDVAILKKCGIIQNRLIDDKSAADFFNSVCKDINFDLKDSEELRSLHQHVTKYYTKNDYKFYQLRKKFIPDYFDNAWAIPSMIAAFILLACTVAQTVYTIYFYYKPPKNN